MPPPRIPLHALLSRIRTSADVRKSILIFGKGFLGVHLFIAYIGTIGPTEGVSMVPTISDGYRSRARILESRLHRRGRGIRVGDVITFTSPRNAEALMCKRVIGMPGDFVSVVSAARDDKDLEKRDEEGKWARVKEEVVRVPEGHCWVAGDNLEWSRDSRVFGAVPLGLVKGKVRGVVWPWREMKWFGEGLQDVQRGDHEWVAGRY